MPAEVGRDAKEVVEEVIPLEEVDEAARATDEETTSEKEFIGEVQASEECIGNETFKDALNIVVVSERKK